jgi:hypothetical protein
LEAERPFVFRLRATTKTVASAAVSVVYLLKQTVRRNVRRAEALETAYGCVGGRKL